MSVHPAYPHLPAERECRTCGHTLDWHTSEGGASAPCFRCDSCDGWLDEDGNRATPCGAGHEKAQGWRCRRKKSHGGAHAEGANRWLESAAVYSKEESVEYEDARPVANPDRVRAGDSQVGGEHYRQTGVQPWDVIDAWGLDFYAGNALKYLYRAGRKGPKVEDLKKARHYIDKLIEREEGVG